MFTVPDECVRYIRWQRHTLLDAHVPDPEEVKRRYVADIEAEFAQMEPYLPDEVESIIDVGCGMAGIDVLLKRKFPEARLTLLDSDGENLYHYDAGWGGLGGWHTDMAPYTNRAAAESLLAANGFQVDKWMDVGTNEGLDADLIVSLYSWGFHYPLSTYKVDRGLAIADLQRPVEPKRGRIVHGDRKRFRCAFTPNERAGFIGIAYG